MTSSLTLFLEAEGQRLIEGGHINRSLLTLGTVINKLADQAPHIPYRDSTLTKILQPALGGNSKTAVICTITPSALHLEETKSTLHFANRAKEIECAPIVNEVSDDRKLLLVYKRKIAQLQKQISAGSQEDHAHELDLQLKDLRDANEQLQQSYSLSAEKQSQLESEITKYKRLLRTAQEQTPSENSAGLLPLSKRDRRLTWAPGSLLVRG